MTSSGKFTKVLVTHWVSNNYSYVSKPRNYLPESPSDSPNHSC